MEIGDMYALGFCSSLKEHGIDPFSMVKAAKDDGLEMNPTRDIPKDERKSLLASLPPARRKQIVKFLLEELTAEGEPEKDRKYIVTAKDHDKSRGEYTYIPSKDRLYESALQQARNERKRNFRARTRLMWLGF